MDNVIEILKVIPTYSKELGLDLNNQKDRFLWFLASMLFAKRISTNIAMKTFRVFIREELTDPYLILEAGWDKLVDILDSGGYVRYDFSTASNLLEAMKLLVIKYEGDIDEVHRQASDYKDLEKRLMEFKGVGPTAVSIFLRELRGIWPKAKPKISNFALDVADKLGFSEEEAEAYEAILIRIYIEYCKKNKCESCPLRNYCKYYIS